MHKQIKLFLVIFLTTCISLTGLAAKKITIHTMPENATISIDGAEVGNGTYTVKFEKKIDFYLVKVSAPSYLTNPKYKQEVFINSSPAQFYILYRPRRQYSKTNIRPSFIEKSKNSSFDGIYNN